MRNLFSTPKRAIITILVLAFFVAMGISGVVMGLAMGGKL